MSESNEVIPAAPEPAPAAPARDDAAIINRWLTDCIYNSTVSRSPEAWNHLTETALPELLRRLAATPTL